MGGERTSFAEEFTFLGNIVPWPTEQFDDTTLLSAIEAGLSGAQRLMLPEKVDRLQNQLLTIGASDCDRESRPSGGRNLEYRGRLDSPVKVVGQSCTSLVSSIDHDDGAVTSRVVLDIGVSDEVAEILEARLVGRVTTRRSLPTALLGGCGHLVAVANAAVTPIEVVTPSRRSSGSLVWDIAGDDVGKIPGSDGTTWLRGGGGGTGGNAGS